jgi:rhamnosyltransferase
MDDRDRGPVNRRLCVFAHFDRQNVVDEYVHYYLSSLRPLVTTMVFVSTARLGADDLARLNDTCDRTLVRENAGYDFGSWQAGLDACADAFDYDEVVLCNDSVYGPLFPLEDMFGRMEEAACDFWGITESTAIAYHLQSYFLVFKKRALRSPVLKAFWTRLGAEKDKEAVITKYEVGLTQDLVKAGYTPAAYAPVEMPVLVSLHRQVLSKLRRKKSPVNLVLKFLLRNAAFRKKGVNPTHFFWKELIRDCRMPFVKVELLRDNPRRVDTGDFESFLQSRSAYPVHLIKGHLERMWYNSPTFR